ncbi:hypothetical protein COCON_G00045220 [Conger conger]|uniref:G-protein coupled receptors family 1 profile domain-containing protein n=1 Tax=Conger conger TaxID=82655 RepID=A0A9Q1DUF2_CONCO|nr:hypothetical protein COCON_G00045220 [Conger conger]
MNLNTSQNATDHKNLVFVGSYSLIFVAGTSLNIIALVVFFCHTKSRSHTIVYMTNLAVADLLLVSTLPVRIYYFLGFKGLSQKLCEGLGLVLLVNMYGSIFLLTCMSFDRCMAVCYPMSSRVKEGRKKAPLVCLCVWMLTVGASMPIYLFKTSTQNDDNNSCFTSTPAYATQSVAVFTTLTIGFGIPLTTMMTCSWLLVKAINRSTVAQTEMIDSQKIKRMISVSLLIFLVCFLPYHMILGLYYFYSIDHPSLVTAYHYSLLLACFNAMLDPLAYYFTTETFRKNVDIKAVRKMWPLNSYSSDDNNQSCVGPLNT